MGGMQERTNTMTDNDSIEQLRRIIEQKDRALAAADVEMRRLYADLEAARTGMAQAALAMEAHRAALDETVGALLMERAVSERARVYILDTSGAYPGDEQQIELLTKWLEACKKRGEK
jgi:hypothetical protein